MKKLYNRKICYWNFSVIENFDFSFHVQMTILNLFLPQALVERLHHLLSFHEEKLAFGFSVAVFGFACLFIVSLCVSTCYENNRSFLNSNFDKTNIDIERIVPFFTKCIKILNFSAQAMEIGKTWCQSYWLVKGSLYIY